MPRSLDDSVPPRRRSGNEAASAHQTLHAMRAGGDHDAAGFTLIELLVVVATVGVLAGIAVPIYSAMHKSARVAKARGDVRAMVVAVTQYASHTGAPPAALSALTVTTSNALGQTAGPFLASVPSAPTGWADYAYSAAADGTYTISATGDDTTVKLP